MKQTGQVEYKRTILLDILGLVHVPLLLLPAYGLMGAFLELSGGQLMRLMVCAAFPAAAALIGFFAIRKLRHFIPNLFVAVLLVALSGLGAWTLNRERLAVGVLAVVVTVIFTIAVCALRLYSRLQAGELKNDFEAAHMDQENVVLEAYEIDTFLNYPEPGHWAWISLFYAAGLAAKSSAYLHFVFWILAADVLICFLFHYFRDYHQYVRMNHGLANLPLRMMGKVHRTFLAAGVVLLLLFMAPGMLYGKEPLQQAVENMIEREREKPGASITDMEEQTVADQEVSTESMDSIFTEEYVTPKWVRVFYEVLTWVFGIGCGAFLLYLVFVWIRGISREYGSGDGEDEVISLRDISETRRTLRRKRKEAQAGPNGMVRKYYRRLIRKGISGTPDPALSPAQLEEAAGTGRMLPDKAEALHKLYEKARYSREGVSREEAEGLEK